MKTATIGSKIRQERESRAITLREFARRLGISAAYLVDIEKNRRLPSKKILQKVADLLELPISTFDELSPELPKPVRAWIKKHPKANVGKDKKGAPPKNLWAVELEELEKEKLILIVSPITKKVLDVSTEKLKPEPEEEDED